MVNFDYRTHLSPNDVNASNYDAAMTQLLDGVPPVIATFIRSSAWEDGHSAGYGEVYNCALGMLYDMKDVINEMIKLSTTIANLKSY